MQCSNCGKTDRVTIGQKQYCTHCGKALGAADNVAPTPQVAVPTRPRIMNDLSAPAATPTVLPADMETDAAPIATTAPAVTPPLEAPHPAPLLTSSPVAAPKPTPFTPAAPISAPNPARAFHASTTVAPKGSVLDLRHVAVTPPPASTTTVNEPTPSSADTSTPSPAAPTPTPAPISVAVQPEAKPEPTMVKPVMPSLDEPAIQTGAVSTIRPSTEPTSTPSTSTPGPADKSHVVGLTMASARREERLNNAQAVSQSSAISKFGSPATVPTTPAPDVSPIPVRAPEPVTVSLAPANPPQPAVPTQAQLAPATGPATSPVTSTTSNNPGPQIIMPTAASTPASSPVLPNSVVHQVENLAKAVPPVTFAESKPAPAVSVKPINAAAVLAAITVLAGYIWVNNYPKMTLHAAAGKAGIEASLPGYVPSSFSLNGPISTSPGQITLNFTNPAHNEQLQITQQRTAWDASSLLDNYVAKNHDQYLAIQGQGLTIYVYDQNHASWVNRGIWYNITGNNNLSRDQLLKVAYSL